MNCLLQKALRDKVLTNRCNMDSILWFHLECPKAVSKFDDPLEFKRKFRDFFADAKTAAENMTYMSEETRKIKEEYNHTPYPEDVRLHKEYRQFQDTFKEFSPVYKPEPEEEFENEDLDDPIFDTDDSNPQYGKISPLLLRRPITREDAVRK